MCLENPLSSTNPHPRHQLDGTKLCPSLVLGLGLAVGAASWPMQ